MPGTIRLKRCVNCGEWKPEHKDSFPEPGLSGALCWECVRLECSLVLNGAGYQTAAQVRADLKAHA